MATITKLCFYCRRPFEASHALANICSPDCRARTAASRADTSEAPLDHPEPEPRAIDRLCAGCGTTMPGAPGEKKYCRPECKHAVRRKRRRALLRRARVETVSMSVLRLRDADRCRICGEPVDFSTRPPDPRAATIDHVVALSKGGAHSYENTQLAHLRCNLAKGAG
jgi:5-methylcytosine-specific restriction endonuclease McrA